jgi:hypothetical protein
MLSVRAPLAGLLDGLGRQGHRPARHAAGAKQLALANHQGQS